MKVCAACHRLYPNDAESCSIGGEPLQPVLDLPPPSDPDDARIGAELCRGRYRIFRKVADGGMGRVYQALDIEADRAIALKVLHDDVAADSVSFERLRREFAISSSLPHEFIVDVIAFEKAEDGAHVLVMEYLEGEELRTVLKREKVLKPARLVKILAQVAIGLTAAHERKIVHRDLKPDNIFLCRTSEGTKVKILDFGSVRDNSEGAKKLTAMGTTIGSPFYMSPEQAQGLRELDHRADVWSMAAIAYEALTGKVPFSGATAPAVLLAIMNSNAAPVSEAGRVYDVPPTLDVVMDEALAKPTEKRTASIGTFVDRFGAAFGLMGSHIQWARMSEAELSDLIRSSLPALLERVESSARIDLSAMDKAFASEQSFRAGLEGGPLVEARPAKAPLELPRWAIPAVAVGAVVIGIVVTVLLMRL